MSYWQCLKKQEIDSMKLACLILMTFFSLTAVGQITVCKSCPITTLKQALLEASAGDIINIQKGIYNEHEIIIDKPITIIGEDYPVIDGAFKGGIIKVMSDNVTVDGLFLKNVGVSYTEDHAAIKVIKSNNFIIRNLVLENLFFGIYIEKSDHGEIYHNKVVGDAEEEYNSGNGIHLWSSNNIKIEKNIVTGVRDGIYLEFVNNSTINDNVSYNNLRYGLHFMFSNHDAYSNNMFENNGSGVAVMFSKHIKMFKNTFKNNWGTASYGLLLKEINDAEITNNIFTKNSTGINIEGSNRINYINNSFEKNGWAIKVRGACYTNTFAKNNFLYNSFDVSYNSKMNDNVLDGNYWSEYTGYDLDKNGVGDIPYRPVKLFSYVVNRTPETLILMRSLFIDIINFSEKVSPIFTPDLLIDANPSMRKL